MSLWSSNLHDLSYVINIIQVGSEAKQRLKQRINKGVDAHVTRNQITVHRKRLYPYMKIVKDKGGLAMISKPGYEADDAIGAISLILIDKHPEMLIMIASGDSDMQQFIQQRVSWLKIQDALSEFVGNSHPDIPNGLDVVGHNAFMEKYKFRPQYYVDYLSYIGKKELCIGGVGIGSGSALKLVQQYGSIRETAKRAAEGRLNGWDHRVQQLFTPGSIQNQKLLGNHALLQSRSEKPDLVLTASQKSELTQFSLSISTNQGVASTTDKKIGLERSILDINKLHPMVLLRWKYVYPYADLLCRIVHARGVQATLQGISQCGLLVDVLFQGTYSIFICCPKDFSTEESCQKWLHSVNDQSLNAESLTKTLLGEGETPFDPFRLASFLHGSTRQYIRQVRKTGGRVTLLPWCIVMVESSTPPVSDSE